MNAPQHEWFRDRMITASPKHFLFVDAVRGLAILGVILFHVEQVMPGASPVIKTPASFGGMGVQLFFIISAFTLFWSFKNRRSMDRKPLTAFYLRRIFRVVPLFWIGVLFYLGHPDYWRSQFAPNGVGTSQIITTLLFIHGWYPTTINSVVPGGWSIGAEMMFYLTLGFLFRLVRTFNVAFALAAISSGVVAIATGLATKLLSAHFPPSCSGLISLFVNFSFPAQFPVFCWGIVLFFLVTDPAGNHRKRLAAIAICLPLLAFGPVYLPISVGMTLLIFGLAIHPVKVLTHRSIRFIGLVSYSMYLWHFFILDWIAPLLVPALHFDGISPTSAASFKMVILYFVIVTITLGVASVSYYVIERPFIRLGSWLIRVTGC